MLLPAQVQSLPSVMLLDRGWTALAKPIGMTPWSEHGQRLRQGSPGISLFELVLRISLPGVGLSNNLQQCWILPGPTPDMSMPEASVISHSLAEQEQVKSAVKVQFESRLARVSSKAQDVLPHIVHLLQKPQSYLVYAPGVRMWHCKGLPTG